ncbi:MAG: hypothetical protein HN919_10640 [Verrucomicrobia bacterium]|jgi:hypothetical protein|nr:hypothetical protein [Verrucomicrobiota bacterium]MBT7066750.1 hypothetical protein [Verrucomicrobiota bacterium]MBT7701642.1 hypothetical protein [Verrucomicrobiota bacterium]
MKSTEELVAEGLAERGVPVLLIGGMALPAFDVVRQTVDMDCLLVDTQEGALNAVLTEAGYEELQRVEGFAQYVSSSVYLTDVDVMLVDEGTFEKIVARSQPLDLGRTIMRVPCAAHMIMLKLHATKNNPKRATRDVGDIVEILRNRPEQVSDDELRAMCERYGPDGVYNRITEAL